MPKIMEESNSLTKIQKFGKAHPQSKKDNQYKKLIEPIITPTTLTTEEAKIIVPTIQEIIIKSETLLTIKLVTQEEKTRRERMEIKKHF